MSILFYQWIKFMERMHINFDLRMSIVSNISERCKTYPFKIYYVKIHQSISRFETIFSCCWHKCIVYHDNQVIWCIDLWIVFLLEEIKTEGNWIKNLKINCLFYIDVIEFLLISRVIYATSPNITILKFWHLFLVYWNVI